MSKETDRLDREIRELEKALADAHKALAEAAIFGDPLTFDELEALPVGSIVRTRLGDYRKDALGGYHSPDTGMIINDLAVMEGNEPLLVSMAEPMTVGSVVRVGEYEHAIRLYTGKIDGYRTAWAIVDGRGVSDFLDWHDLNVHFTARPYIEKEN